MSDVVSKFLSYVDIQTTSDFYAPEGTPSTQNQFVLANLLVEELKALGITDARVDETCYVYGTLPATPGCEDLPAIGLIAHMDTSPDLTAEHVKPQIIRYEGGDILLNEKEQVVMKVADFPFLEQFVGEELICTDGTTLLGADDKSGIAIIMQVLENFIGGNRPHGKICVSFTPDEEIGRGASNFDVAGFGADFAYTLDGGAPDRYSYETFNAAWAKVTIQGRSIHPGTSKDKMKNANLIAWDFISLLPPLETPTHTEEYQGFYHLTDTKADVDRAELCYIIRDHSMERFTERKAFMEQAVEQLNRKWGEGTAQLEMFDQYYNMYEILKEHMEIVDLMVAAIKAAGIEEPKPQPIRGGTDGCMLTFKGLLCPNMPSGGYNYHGRFEFIPICELHKCVEITEHLLDPAIIRASYLKQ